MKKMYVGARLRRLRTERGLTQAALAKSLELSTSYVNQLENDLRPLTVPVLLRLNTVFDLDVQFFASDTDARLIADVQDVLAEVSDPGRSESGWTADRVQDLVTRSPDAARALVALHRRLHSATEQLDRFSRGAAGDRGEEGPAEAPYENVRDFFYDRRNHIAALDEAAEQRFTTAGLHIGGLDRQLEQLLSVDHDISVVFRDGAAGAPAAKRSYDRSTRTLALSRELTPGQRAFQMATQLAFLEHGTLIDAIAAQGTGFDEASTALTRVGLAHYYAGALLLPYGLFLDAAEQVHYDIDVLRRRFEVGFETICHRLSTLQRPGRRGVPMFFVRTDRAGNISKRQSATAFHFSRVGGSCPLWVVHDAFARPGRILTQIAQMPDGRSYLWIARTTGDGPGAYGGPRREFAIGLRCDLTYADRLVYSRGLDLTDPDIAVPIGAGCKVCDRRDCAQRAFPQIGEAVHVDLDRTSRLPYPLSGNPSG